MIKLKAETSNIENERLIQGINEMESVLQKDRQD